jgi:YHS domain-containing protein
MTKLSDTCRVCGMAAKIEVSSLKYHKMYLHFCSEQCRETFIAHPSLYSVSVEKHQKAIITHQTMSLAEQLDNKEAHILINHLIEMMGVKEVVVDTHKIKISYDLLQVTRKQIENRLIEVGIELGNDWVERLRRVWVHDSEENELANLASPIHYYNRPPPKS